MKPTSRCAPLVALCTIVFSLRSAGESVPVDSATALLPVIPRPVSMEPGKGFFTLDAKTPIRLVPADKRMGELDSLFRGFVNGLFGVKLASPLHGRSSMTPAITFRLAQAKDSLGTEGYCISAGRKRIEVRAASDAGIFYAMQTLLQLISRGDRAGSFKIPAVEIRDYPRFRWRGMHLDVCRHFFPAEFIRKYIDILAMHKINVFHWHLTEDQGWRIEIKKYPRLTEIGAWRADRGNLPWELCEPQKPGEKTRYGGYYSQDEVRDIVRYAAARCITVIPEIEMPAHSLAALAAYPEFSCDGGPFSVATGHVWPDTNIFCAGNEGTFKFLEDVLDEVISLFPSNYIHVGGDEANKAVWKRCPRCQARIKAEGLSGESELQGYFIKRIEKFLNSRGKRLIGWDEILEGGLAPEATVMSWRGMDGGIAAARAGHDVIMSPTSFCYFDYYQGDPEQEPLAIGGYLTAKTVYEFEPAPDSLTPGQKVHILGGQGNLWTEYVPTTDRAEYMVLPRMAALAEVVWTPKELRSWEDFARRLPGQLAKYSLLHWNAAHSLFQVRVASAVDTAGRKVTAALTCDMPGTIRYTLDGSAVTSSSPAYVAPVGINRTGTLQASEFQGNAAAGPVVARRFVAHAAAFCGIRYATPPSPNFPAGGRYTLVDMVRGGNDHENGLWQGFARNDFDAVLDLGAVKPVGKVTSGFLQNVAARAFFPDTVRFALSTDGVNFTELNGVANTMPLDKITASTHDFGVACPGASSRYVRVRAKNIGACPPWHPAAGQDAWLFVDEIMVQ